MNHATLTTDNRILLRVSDYAKLGAVLKTFPDAKWNRDGSWSIAPTPVTVLRLERLGCQLDRSLGDLLAAGYRCYKRPPMISPVCTTTKPFPHQDTALRHASAAPASYLAMDMGTGKTLVACGLIEHWNCQRVVVLCPVAVRGVWPREYRTHTSGRLPVVVLDKGTAAQKAARVKDIEQGIIVVNYESAWRDSLAKSLLKWQPDLVICDEIHRIKSPTGKASKFAYKLGLGAKCRLGLSGTPLPHSPLDAFGQWRFLDPGVFGTNWNQFRFEYAVYNQMFPHMVDSLKNQDDLQAKIGPFMYRVMARDVLKDLPPCTHEVIPVELEKGTQKVYDELEQEFVAEVNDGVITVANALVKLLRLQQITSGYVVLDHDDPDQKHAQQISEEKQKALADLLEDVPADDPVVVFAVYRQDLANIAQVAKQLGRRYGEVSGSRKDLTPDATMPKDIDLLGVQIASGGVGIDLTRARVAVYYSQTFNMGNYEQSIARLVRQGQTRPVVMYHLVAQGCVDETVYEALKDKKEVVEECLTRALTRVGTA